MRVFLLKLYLKYIAQTLLSEEMGTWGGSLAMGVLIFGSPIRRERHFFGNPLIFLTEFHWLSLRRDFFTV